MGDGNALGGEEVDGRGVVVAQCGVDKTQLVQEAVCRIEIVQYFGLVDGPDIMGDHVPGVNRKGRVHGGDGGHHALLEPKRRVAFGMTVRTTREQGLSGGVILGIRTAADGLGAFVVGAGLVGPIHVRVANMRDPDRRLAARRGAMRRGFGDGKGDVVRSNLGIVAEANHLRTERFRGMRAHFELLKDVICGGPFGSDDTSTDVGVLHLTEQSGFWVPKSHLLCLTMTYLGQLAHIGQDIDQDIRTETSDQLESSQESLSQINCYPDFSRLVTENRPRNQHR